jgi:hypothetical protein
LRGDSDLEVRFATVVGGLAGLAIVIFVMVGIALVV